MSAVCFFYKNHHILSVSKGKVEAVWKALGFKESLHLFYPLSVSVHSFNSCWTDVLLHFSKHQTEKNKQADCWIFNAKHLTMTGSPDAFILYFFHKADSFDAAWTKANLCEKRVRKSFLWQMCLVKNSGAGWQETHTKVGCTKVTLSGFCSVSVLHCFCS